MTKQRIHNEWFRPIAVTHKVTIKTVLKADFACSNLSCSNRVYTCLFDAPGICRDCNKPLEAISNPEPYDVKQYGPMISSRKTCKVCRVPLEENEFMWSWGEYHNAKWRTITHFCKSCFPEHVQSLLLKHRAECGCDFNLIGKGHSLPEWLWVPECQQNKQQS